MTSSTVIFRADASQYIGSGHVMRCSSLAAELRCRGYDVRFICRRKQGDLVAWLERGGFPVTALPAGTEVESEDYRGWLGVSLDTEIAQMNACLAGGAEWLIVDHYALDAAWESAMRTKAVRILAVDDLANRSHDCDLLVDQNAVARAETRYTGLVPPGAPVLAGPHYAMLRDEFASGHASAKPRTGRVRKVLVFLGGGGGADVTMTVLSALVESPQAKHLTIDVVIGVASHHSDDIFTLSERHPGVRVHRRVDTMAEMMMNADLAIGATGVSTWERAAMGLPALAVHVAENQREIAQEAERLGLLTWLGDARAVSVADWRTAFETACRDPQRLRNQSLAGLSLVDGCGTRRVAEAMA